jgi:hypothetical protein
VQREVDQQSAPTAQDLYDEINAVVSEVESDIIDIDRLIVLLGLSRAFVEENHQVE